MASAIPVQRSTNWANKPTGSWLCSRIDFQTNAQEAQAQHAFNALTIAPSGEGLTISNASKLTYLTLPLGVVQFCISLVGLQTELDSTQSYHHH